MQTIKILNTQ